MSPIPPLSFLPPNQIFEVTDPTPNPSPTREGRAAALVKTSRPLVKMSRPLVKMSRPYTSHLSLLTSHLSLLLALVALVTPRLDVGWATWVGCFLLSLSYVRTQETNTSIGASTDFSSCAYNSQSFLPEIRLCSNRDLASLAIYILQQIPSACIGIRNQDCCCSQA